MSLPTLTFRTVTLCADARCMATGACWREANERYGNAPGENYGPRCVPVPSFASGAASVYALGVEEGERRATAAVVAWLRGQVSQRVGEDDLAYDRAATIIERGEHRREVEL